MRQLLPLLVLAIAGCATHQPPPYSPGELDLRDGGGPAAGPRALFISPMGEPFRVDHPERAWFAGADGDGDGRLVRAEFRTDAARFFAQLDRNADGEIDPDDVEVYETGMVPELRVAGPGGGRGRALRGGGRGRPPGGGGPGGSAGRGGPGGSQGGDRAGAQGSARAGFQGASRYGYLDLPEPVTSADRNFNRGIDATEFQAAADQRFALLDRNGDGAITAGELPSIDTRVRGTPGRRPPGEPLRGEERPPRQ